MESPAPRSILFALMFAVVSFIGTSGEVLADTIQFDPDGAAAGNSSNSTETFDFLPGNILFKGIGDITVVKSGQAVDQFMQARLGKLLDGNGNPIAVNGLNSNFELTVVLGYSAIADSDGTTTAVDLAANPNVNFFELWYDNNAGTQANDLAGTGFNDGTLILSGMLSEASGVFSRVGQNERLDQFGSDDYSNQQTVKVAGGASLTVSVTSADANFFGVLPPLLQLALYNSSITTPYNQVNPSGQFLGYAPNSGAVNGLGSDFRAQADANASFTVVPEPSSLALAVVAGLGLALAVRRRATR